MLSKIIYVFIFSPCFNLALTFRTEEYLAALVSLLTCEQLLEVYHNFLQLPSSNVIIDQVRGAVVSRVDNLAVGKALINEY